MGQQTSSILFRNFNTTNQLPSLEVYGIEQDTEGYMWFITDNGISRYDGYTFQNYSLDDGFESNVFFEVHKGKNGSLWFVTHSGQISIYENGKFRPYEFNSKLSQYPVPHLGISLCLDTIRNSLYIGYINSGILEIDERGETKMHSIEGKSGFYIKKINSKLVSITIKDNKYRNKNFYKKTQNGDIIWDNNKSVRYKPKKLLPYFRSMGQQIGEDSLLILNHNKVLFYIDSKFQKERTFSCNINKIIKTKNGQYWLCFGQNGGLQYFNSLERVFDSAGTRMLDNQSISNVFFDKDQSIWVSSLNNGVYYSPNPRITKYNFLQDGVRSLTKIMNYLFMGQTNRS